MIFPIWTHRDVLATKVAVKYLYDILADRNYPNNFPTEPHQELTERFLEWYATTEDKAEYILHLKGIMI